MSGLAVVATELGAVVTGSDRAGSEYTDLLENHGVEFAIEHDAGNVSQGSEVVISSAIPEDNPELVRAKQLGLKILHRAELLAEISSIRSCIAVTGTHGKTTTAGMTVHCMKNCGRNTGYVVGGMLPASNTNASLGEEWMVIEADESDRSFLYLNPDIIVVTNLELDHHATFTSKLEVEEAVSEFLGHLTKNGTAVLPDSPDFCRLVSDDVDLVLFSAQATGEPKHNSAEGHLFTAKEIAFEGTGSTFVLMLDGEMVTDVKLAVPGLHNILNALAALGASSVAGIDPKEAAQALSSYIAVERRFEKKGDFRGAAVFDDYAHHPSEVKATLDAARNLGPNRLIAVFQPHLYSRTLYLAREFGEALSSADVIVVTDVYPAREEPVGELEGVDGKMVANFASDAARGRPVYWVPELEQASALLSEISGDGDLVLTMGAGDIHTVAEDLVG